MKRITGFGVLEPAYRAPNSYEVNLVVVVVVAWRACWLTVDSYLFLQDLVSILRAQDSHDMNGGTKIYSDSD